MDLSDEAPQAAAGGREEGCADSSSVAPLYTFLYRPPALSTSSALTDYLLDFMDCCIYVTDNNHLANSLLSFMGKQIGVVVFMSF